MAGLHSQLGELTTGDGSVPPKAEGQASLAHGERPSAWLERRARRPGVLVPGLQRVLQRRRQHPSGRERPDLSFGIVLQIQQKEHGTTR